MMDFSKNNGSGCPCKECKDRYPACHDHCEKSEYVAWREKMATMKKAEQDYRKQFNCISDANIRASWRNKRYSRQVNYNKGRKTD